MKHLLLIILSLTNTALLFSQQTVGLIQQDTGSTEGYILFAPAPSKNTYLIDKCGKLVHSWTGTYNPGLAVYLQPNGDLLRTGNLNNPNFIGGGRGGNLERYDWDNNLLWTYTISSNLVLQHHDICPLPNGNILAIVWEKKTSAAAIAAGRDPSLVSGTLWSEKIIEIQPIGTDSGTTVWEWNLWDHLIQEFDATKSNYGAVVDFPELINFNYATLGTQQDWTHINSVDYNPELDQILLSAHNFSEIWIIDHSTSTSEAASHSGGNSGKGGDLLYRWGNPEAYNRGASNDRIFYTQHNAQWIKPGLPGAGNVLVFNNGSSRPDGDYSAVEEFTTPVDLNGNYPLANGQHYLPLHSLWTYTAPTPTDFFSHNVSGAQRLDNGQTVVCEGQKGKFFEIGANDSIVWTYINPVISTGPVNQGTVLALTTNSVFRCSFYSPDYSAFTGRTLSAGNPVESNPLPYTCDITVGTNENNITESDIDVFPNPFINEFNIVSEYELREVTIQLTNSIGQLIAQKSLASIKARSAIRFSFEKDFPSGIYYLSFVSENSVSNKILMK